MTAAIPLPRPAAELDPEPAPVEYCRPLAEIDDDLAMLAVRERRHREQLAGTRAALRDCEVRRQALLAQKARTVAAARRELAAAG